MLPVNQQPVELDDESIMSDMASAHADSDNAFLCLALARELGLPVPDASAASPGRRGLAIVHHA